MNQRRASGTRRLGPWWAAGLIACVTAYPALAQPTEPPAPDARAAREQLRKRFREEVVTLREHADTALRKLDEGADLNAVREDFDRWTRWQGRFSRPWRGEGPERDAGPDDRKVFKARTPDPQGEMTPAERQQTLKFLEENVPRVGAKLRELDSSSPELVTRLLTRMRPRVNEILEADAGEGGDRALRLAEFRASLDVMWARRAMDEARRSGDQGALAARKDELRVAISAHFDAQLARQEHDADRLARRVDKLRSDIKERREMKDRMIERELESPWRGPPDGRPPGPPGPPEGAPRR